MKSIKRVMSIALCLLTILTVVTAAPISVSAKEGDVVVVNGIEAHRGETLLVPACANKLDIEGEATLLTATV